MYKKLLLSLLIIIIALNVCGQTSDSLFIESHKINEENKGSLYLSIDNISFFKNNEYEGDLVDGYTLPGFRLTPHVIYIPASHVKVEAGISLLRYWGTDQYPCFAYNNVSEWQADNYQQGFHILPYFRAQAALSEQFHVVLGNLYGGQNHHLIEPLYNPELNLTADPELGFQILYESKIAKVDVWANWESFIFKNDTHNEAFTIGFSTQFNMPLPKNSPFYLNIPLQGLFIHRGGELDTINGKLQTSFNGTIGVNMGYNPKRHFFKNINLNIMGTLYKNIDGDALPSEKGQGFYTQLTTNFWRMKYKFGYWRSTEYYNLFGNPLYGNYSTTIDTYSLEKPNVFNTGISYGQSFGNGIHANAEVEFFYIPDVRGSNIIPAAWSKASTYFNWSIGICLRINPSILLLKNNS